MSDTPTYSLKEPINRTVRDASGSEHVETITSVPFRKLRPKDLRVADGANGESARGIALVAHMTGLTIHEVDNMEMDDFEELSRRAQGFLPTGQ